MFLGGSKGNIGKKRANTHVNYFASRLKSFIKSFHSFYGNLLKDITLIMKAIKNYYNVILLCKIDYYKND